MEGFYRNRVGGWLERQKKQKDGMKRHRGDYSGMHCAQVEFACIFPALFAFKIQG